jgi:hypothetical protein
MLSYEELKGAAGREIWYRPPRHDARTLFPLSPPRVQVGSELHQLRNISVGGLAVSCRNSAEALPDVGETLDLTIRQAGLPIFESQARVLRREDSVFGATLAFQFVNAYVEFEKLLARNAQAQIAANTQNADPATSLVRREYRMFCADVLATLRSYRSLFDSNAAIARKSGCDFDEASCYDACESRLLQQWRGLWLTGNQLTREVIDQRDILQATKDYTELVLTPEFRRGAVWERAYAKPLGYPGDFEVMNHVYAWQRVGEDSYAKLIHRLGIECAACVTTRMHVVRRHMGEMVQDRIGRPAQILSLGCGPAREVELFLAERPHLGAGVRFTLIDQEDRALKQAYERTYPHVQRAGGKVQVHCLNVSFTEILRAGGEIDRLPPQDVIYSVGLLDYLSDRRALSLVRRLYELLAPGGLLMIGNMNETAFSTIWPMECVTDWTLHYRTEPQMLAWTRGLNVAMAWTETEETGHVRILFMRKPPL